MRKPSESVVGRWSLVVGQLLLVLRLLFVGCGVRAAESLWC